MRKFRQLIILLLLLFVGYSLAFGRSARQTTTQSSSPIIDVAHLQQLLKEEQVKFVDAAYGSPKQSFVTDWKKFQKDSYAKFDQLMRDYADKDYLKEHIHGAVPFSLDAGLYVGEFKRHEMYPPEIFEQYVRKLGINSGDHVVVYGRGKLSGMVYAAHVWWLLKHYGLENVQVLNGGLDAWKKAGKSVDSGAVQMREGNFKAKVNTNDSITFDGLEHKDADGTALIDHLNTINVFDARPNDQYTGKAPLHYDSNGPMKGFHIQGAKSLPASDLVNDAGLKSPQEIWRILENAGYVKDKTTITYCSVGNQGSLDYLALTYIGIPSLKLYQGGMTEMALRDPARIA